MKKRNLWLGMFALIATVAGFFAPSKSNEPLSVTAATADDPLSIAGNKLANPYIQYSGSAVSIPNWQLLATNNIYQGQGNPALISQTVSGNRREVVSNKGNGFQVIPSNNAYNFTSYTAATTATSGFMNISQTFNNLVAGSTYYFRAEVRGNANIALLVFPNTGNSGGNSIISQYVDLTSHTTSRIVEVAFKATQSQYTVNIRHHKITTATSLNIRRIGFYGQDDYLIEKKMNSLFTDATRTKIDPDLSYEDFIRVLNELKAEILANPGKYSADVLASINAKIAEAEALWNSMETVYKGVTNYADQIINDYDLDLSELPASVIAIAEEQKGKIDTSNFDAAAIETYIEEGKTKVLAELLNIERERAKTVLDNLLDSLEDSKIATAIVSELKTQLNGALTIDEVQDLLAFGVEILTGDFTYEITSEPGAHTFGTIVFTNDDYDGKSVSVNLPVLNGEDYDVSFTEDPLSSVNYVLTDSFLASEEIEFSLSFDQDNLTSYTVKEHATYTSAGLISGTSSDYPGFSFDYTLPALTDPGYSYVVDRATNKINYVYNNDEIPYSTSVDLVGYNNTQFFWSVDSEPTKDSPGQLKGTSYLYPGVVFEVELPKLDSVEYTVTVKDKEVPPYVSYILKDQTYGFVEIKLLLDDFNNADTVWDVVEPSKFDVGGVLNGQNPNYPGAIFTQTLPKLDDVHYTRETDLDTDEYVYDLIDNPYNVGPFRVAIPDVYYVSLSGFDTEIGDEGTFDKPFLTLETALSRVGNGASKTIVLLDDIEISGTLNINNKKITLTSANKELYVETATEWYTLSGVTNDFSLFNLTNNAELVIEHITLDAKQVGGAAQNTAIVEALNSKVIVNDGAILTGANSTKLGSVFLLKNTPFYMYGGEITDNEGVSHLIDSNSSLYLAGGKITDNHQNQYAVSGTGFTFGYDFSLKNNGVEGKLNFVFSASSNVKIRFDFIGEIDVTDTRSPLSSVILTNVKSVDFDGNEISYNLNDYPGIKPLNDMNLHLVYDHSVSSYRWDYNYVNDYSLITSPTSSDTGIIAKKAIIDGVPSDTVYSGVVVLPKLSENEYVVTPDLDNDKVTYTWKNTQFGDVEIVLLVDETVVYHYDVVTDPTFTKEGEAQKVSDAFPGVVFEDNITLPKLSAEDYDIVLDKGSDTVTYTLKPGSDAPGAVVTTNVETFNEGFKAIIDEIGKDKDEDYGTGEAVAAVLAEAENGLINATDFAEVEAIINELDARLEAASKLDDLFESFSHGVGELTQERFEDAIDEIINADVSDLDDVLHSALEDITRLEIEHVLSDYISGLNDAEGELGDKITEILADFDALNLDTSEDVIDFEFADFIEGAKGQLIAIEKESTVDELSDFLAAIDKTALSDEQMEEIGEIINETLAFIDGEGDIDKLNEILEEAKIAINNTIYAEDIAEAKEEVKADITDVIDEFDDYLSEEKKEALDDYLESLLAVIDSTNYDDEAELALITDDILDKLFDFIGSEAKEGIVEALGEDTFVSNLITEMIEEAITIEELLDIIALISEKEAELAELNTQIEGHKDVIASNELEDVIAAIMDDYLNGVTTLELAEEKIESIIELVNYFPSNDPAVTTIVKDGIDSIVGATTSIEVEEALESAIEDIVDYKRDEIIAELQDYHDNTENAAIKAIIVDAIDLLNAATSVDELLDIYQDTLVKIEIEHLKEYTSGNSVIDDYIDTIIAGLDEYATDEEKLEALSEAIAQVDAALYLEKHVSDQIGTGNEMSENVSGLLGDYINQLLTSEDPTSLLEDLVVEIDKVIAFEEIKAALDPETLPYAESFLDGILEALAEAEDSAAVADILSEGLRDALLLNDLIVYGEELFGTDLDTKQAVIDEIVETMLTSDTNTLAEAKEALLDEYKKDALKEVNDYVGEHESSDVSALITALESDLSSALTKADVDTLKETAIKDILAVVVSENKTALDDYLAGLTPEEQALVTTIINEGKVALDDLLTGTAITLKDVSDLVAEIMLEAEQVIAKAELDAAKIDAETILVGYVDSDFSDLLEEYIDEVKANIDNATSVSEVETLLSEALEKIDSLSELKDYAESLFGSPLPQEWIDVLENLINDVVDVNSPLTAEEAREELLDLYKEEIKDQIDAAIALLDNPSAEVLAIVSAGKGEVDAATTKAEVDALLIEIVAEAEAQQALDLQALYAAFVAVYTANTTTDAYQYSAAGLSELAAIYAQIKADYDAGVITKAELTAGIADLNAVGTNSTSSEVRPGVNDDVTLDDDEAYGVGEFSGEGGETLDKDTVLVIEILPEISDVDAVLDFINSKDLQDMLSALTAEELYELLKDQKIYGALDIYLVDADGNRIAFDKLPSGTYTIRLLLPENLRDRDNIRVIYMTSSGLEVYSVTRTGNWISFETTHFSTFYLVGDLLPSENTINIWWLLIMETIMILVLAGLIFLKKRRDHKQSRAYSTVLPVLAVVLPTYGWVIAIILALIIIGELAYLIYLFLKSLRKEKVVEREVVKEVVREVEVPVVPVVPVVLSEKPKAVIYNYSFRARLHLMDEGSREMYNKLANSVMKYGGVEANETWDHQAFTHKGKMFAKLRFHGKTFKLYLALETKSIESPKFPLVDESKHKTQASTPTLLNIKGPRMLNYGLELLEKVMSDLGLEINKDYKEDDYSLKAKSGKELFNAGLIKSSDGTFTLKDDKQKRISLFNLFVIF